MSQTPPTYVTDEVTLRRTVADSTKEAVSDAVGDASDAIDAMRDNLYVLKKHWTARDAARYLGYKTDTVQRLMRNGDIRTVAISSRRRYTTMQWVDDYILATGEVTGGPAQSS